MGSGGDESTCPSCGATLVWDWKDRIWLHKETGQEECENWSEEDERSLQEHYRLST